MIEAHEPERAIELYLKASDVCEVMSFMCGQLNCCPSVLCMCVYMCGFFLKATNSSHQGLREGFKKIISIMMTMLSYRAVPRLVLVTTTVPSLPLHPLT